MIGNDLIGKRVKLVFQDSRKVLVKEGVIKNLSPELVEIELEKKIMNEKTGKQEIIKITEFIPMLRILRLEKLKGGNEK